MTDLEKKKFELLCEAERRFCDEMIGVGIGTYGEKSIHRIFKSFFSGEKSLCEAPVGTYIADILDGDRITEIQTGSFKPLIPKLRYYLEETDCRVRVVKPLIVNKTIIRIDKESGEVLRKRRSPVAEDERELMAQLYHVGDLFKHERLEFLAVLISAEEHRYSERMRYRREGAYDGRLFPTALTDIITFSDISAFEGYLPPESCFSAKEYSAFIGRKGRAVYSILNFLCSVDVLERKKDGKRYIYYRR